MLRSQVAERAVPQARPGDLVIRALVRARLLGIRLLTLEARVVLGPEDGRPVTAATGHVRPGDGPDDPAAAPAVPRPPPPLLASGQLTRAVQLVEQGARTLDRSRTGVLRNGAERG